MKVLAYVDPATGATSIVRPVQSGRLDTETEQEFLARVAARALPAGVVAYDIVDESPILDGDRTFRAALVCSGGKLEHDIGKCRDIHMASIRKARNRKLAALDVETMKALGKGDTATRDAIEAQKQALRDIPHTFDLSAAKSTDELKALWPGELK